MWEEAEEEIARQAEEDRKVRKQQEAAARKAQERLNTLEEKLKVKAADKKPKVQGRGGCAHKEDGDYTEGFFTPIVARTQQSSKKKNLIFLL